MKKIPLLITAGFVALCVGGYFVYEKLLTRTSLTPWDLVPESAVAVYEQSDCFDCVPSVKKSPLWEIIRKAAFYGPDQDSLSNLLDFLNKPNTGMLASLHITKKDNFDFTFYLPMPTDKEKRMVEENFGEWKKKKKYKGKRQEQRDGLLSLSIQNN